MTAVLQQSDFTYLGSFALPTAAGGAGDNRDMAFTNAGFTAISASRMFFLDATALSDSPTTTGPHCREISPPAQNTWTKQAPYPSTTYNTGIVANGDWGFLNAADFHTVWNAGGATPVWFGGPAASASVLVPVGLFYDDVNGWMWTWGSVSYDSLQYNGPNHYASTLNANGTTTSKGYWQTAPAATMVTDTQADGSTAHTQKIMSGMFRVSDTWAAANTGGKKLGMGAGGFFSIFQSASMGPTAFAFSAPAAGTNTTPPASAGGSSGGTLITTQTLLSHPETNLSVTVGANPTGWAKRRNDYWCPQHTKATITVATVPTGATFNLAAVINGTSYTSTTYTVQAGQSTSTVAANWVNNIAAANWPIASVTVSGAVITVLGKDTGDASISSGYAGEVNLTITVGGGGAVGAGDPTTVDDGVAADGSKCLPDQFSFHPNAGQQSVNPTGGYGGSPGTGLGQGYWVWNQRCDDSIWIKTAGGKEGYIVFGLEPTGNIQYDFTHQVTPTGSHYVSWRIYDPADLAKVANGSQNCYIPDAASSFRPADITGFGPAEYTRAIPVAESSLVATFGSWYDSITGYLYLCVGWQNVGGGNRYPLVHVFAVNQSPPAASGQIPASFVCLA